MSTCGIAFFSAFDMRATHVFHVCHVKLVADLYCSIQVDLTTYRTYFA